MDSPSTLDEGSEMESRPSTAGAGCSTPGGGSSIGYCRTISEMSGFSEQSISDEHSAAVWPAANLRVRAKPVLAKVGMMRRAGLLGSAGEEDEEEEEGVIELMKERFSKLLLGEDMSGGGKGVCSAVAISNAITNLYATVFGQFWRLEPLPEKKKEMWRREMECLLCVCDYIVEFYPTVQNFKDGATPEVMASRPRSDIYINLPALEKLDNMLLEILEGFEKTEFWYVDDGDRSPSANISRSFRRVLKRNEEKWWRPIPCLPSYGLSANSRKDLKQKRECANQIHKAAMAINAGILAEMDVPDSFTATLPKDLGQAILESYSRVLESFAFNLVSYIDDVLYIDESVKKR